MLPDGFEKRDYEKVMIIMANRLLPSMRIVFFSIADRVLRGKKNMVIIGLSDLIANGHVHSAGVVVVNSSMCYA